MEICGSLIKRIFQSNALGKDHRRLSPMKKISKKLLSDCNHLQKNPYITWKLYFPTEKA
jgi:hypothetical protein